MVPLSITIVVIYGVIGLVGKDYDMPVAVLSALTLGMAVDFAIHFLERARVTYAETGSWQQSAAEMFGEPARAPMLFHFGEHDPLIPPEHVALHREHHPEASFHLWPAGHGFNCDERSDHDPDCAAAAMDHTVSFLTRHLR